MTPQQKPADAVVAVAALGRALDAVTAALASGSAAGLSATESGLAAAIADVSRIASVAPDDRPRLLVELARARATLNRCRIVGTAIASVIDGCLGVRGLFNTYDRSGAAAVERLTRPGTHLRL